MKTEVVLILLFTLTITACQKQPEQPMAAEPSNEPAVTAEFDQADKKSQTFWTSLIILIHHRNGAPRSSVKTTLLFIKMSIYRLY